MVLFNQLYLNFIVPVSWQYGPQALLLIFVPYGSRDEDGCATWEEDECATY